MTPEEFEEALTLPVTEERTIFDDAFELADLLVATAAPDLYPQYQEEQCDKSKG